MRFSIKWLLATTAYAAVACASVVYPVPAWNALLSIAGFLLIFASLVGAHSSRGALRSWCIGFSIAALLLRSITFGHWTAFSDVHGLFETAATQATVATQMASGATVRGPIETGRYVVGNLDILNVYVAGTPEPGEIAGPYQVGTDGVLLLGAGYGGVSVAGHTIEDAERQIANRLSLTLRAPEVRVLLAESGTGILVKSAPNELAVDAFQQHFILLLSLLGGLLGLWFWRREYRGEAAGGSSERNCQ